MSTFSIPAGLSQLAKLAQTQKNIVQPAKGIAKATSNPQAWLGPALVEMVKQRKPMAAYGGKTAPTAIATLAGSALTLAYNSWGEAYPNALIACNSSQGKKVKYAAFDDLAASRVFASWSNTLGAAANGTPSFGWHLRYSVSLTEFTGNPIVVQIGRPTISGGGVMSFATADLLQEIVVLPSSPVFDMIVLAVESSQGFASFVPAQTDNTVTAGAASTIVGCGVTVQDLVANVTIESLNFRDLRASGVATGKALLDGPEADPVLFVLRDEDDGSLYV